MTRDSFVKCFKKLKICNLQPGKKPPSSINTVLSKEFLAKLKPKTVIFPRRTVFFNLTLSQLVELQNNKKVEYFEQLALQDFKGFVSGPRAKN